MTKYLQRKTPPSMLIGTGQNYVTVGPPSIPGNYELEVLVVNKY